MLGMPCVCSGEALNAVLLTRLGFCASCMLYGSRPGPEATNPARPGLQCFLTCQKCCGVGADLLACVPMGFSPGGQHAAPTYRGSHERLWCHQLRQCRLCLWCGLDDESGYSLDLWVQPARQSAHTRRRCTHHPRCSTTRGVALQPTVCISSPAALGVVAA